MGFLDDFYEQEGISIGGFEQPSEPERRQYVAPERGLLGDVGTGLLRGASVLGESAVRATEPIFGETDWDERIAKHRETSKWMAPDVSEYRGEEGYIKKGLTGALEALPSSVVPAATGAIAATMLIPGVNVVTAGVIGAGAATLGFFGLSEGRKAYKEGIELGMSQQEAEGYGWKKGLTEGGLETLAIVADIMIPMSGRLAKVGAAGVKGAKAATLRNVLRQEPRKYATDMLKIWGMENMTEQAQLEMGAAIDRQYGLEGRVTWEERAQTVATTTWMSLFFGAAGVGTNVAERTGLQRDLQNPEKRDAAANRVYEILKKEQPDIADNFRTVYENAQRQGIDWTIDQNVTNRAQAIVDEARTQAETDKPMEDLYAEYSPDLPDRFKAGTADEILREEKIPSRPEDLGLPADYGQDKAIPELEEASKASPRAEAMEEQASSTEPNRPLPGDAQRTVADTTAPSPAPPETPAPSPAPPEAPVASPAPQEPQGALQGPQVEPEQAVPRTLDEIPYVMEVIEEETGEVVQIETTAREALNDIDTKIESWYLVMECLKS